eukprot:GHVU01025230.1.p1 GENE.GHVU01025230.1~~GHVU01025230.1.p1  ORF type:complete len:183 (+),score=4.78 GHVU01025230.1:228-776(+)
MVARKAAGKESVSIPVKSTGTSTTESHVLYAVKGKQADLVEIAKKQFTYSSEGRCGTANTRLLLGVGAPDLKFERVNEVFECLETFCSEFDKFTSVGHLGGEGVGLDRHDSKFCGAWVGKYVQLDTPQPPPAMRLPRQRSRGQSMLSRRTKPTTKKAAGTVSGSVSKTRAARCAPRTRSEIF